MVLSRRPTRPFPLLVLYEEIGIYLSTPHTRLEEWRMTLSDGHKMPLTTVGSVICLPGWTRSRSSEHQPALSVEMPY